MKKFIAGMLFGAMLVMSFSAFASPGIKLFIDGQRIDSDVQPQMIENRVMVPARYVAEPLGANVSWDADNNAVVISSNKVIEHDDHTITIKDQEYVRLRNLANENDWLVLGDGNVYENDTKLFNWKEVGEIIDARIYIPKYLVD